MQQQAMKVFVLLALIVGSMLGLTIIDDILLDNVTETTTHEQVVALATSTTTATLTLTEKSWFSTTKNMSVVSDIDGNVTADATLSTNRLSVVITGLTDDETHTFTVTYPTEKLSDRAVIGWKLFPLGAVMLALFGVGASVFTGVQSFRGQRTGAFAGVAASMSVFVVLGLGAVMSVVESDFRAEAIALYSIQPDYTGINSLLPLVGLGYVFSLLAIGAGAFGGAVRGAFN